MDPSNPPLSYEASRAFNPSRSSSLPSEVIACLKNARFLHLATCDMLFPHVSLMNYTYLASSPFSPHPSIVMTTNPSSKKTENMLHNPRVSLLVHDWVSHRPPTTSVTTGPAATEPERTASPPPPVARSSLAALLLNLNTSALSSISATINGTARLVERGTDEEAFYKEAHLRNNTFGEGGEDSGIGQGSENTYQGDGGRGCFIEGEEVMVVVVKVESGRIADWKGAVRDWEVVGAEEAVEEQHSRRSMVNGI